jgi:hypothetical protein
MQAIGALVRSEGTHISNELLRQAIRATRDSLAYAARLGFLNNDSRPNYDRLPPALGQLQRNYSFTVKVQTGLVDANGAPFEQRVTVVTDRKLTKGQILSAAMNSLGNRERYGFQASNPMIESAVQAGFQGTL